MKKTIISMILAVTMSIGLALPVMADEPPPEGGKMYEGDITIQWTIDNVKSKIETVKTRVNIDDHYDSYEKSVEIFFLQDDNEYRITNRYEGYGSNPKQYAILYLKKLTSSKQERYNFDYYPGWHWQRPGSTTISLENAIDKMTVNGIVKDKDGRVSLAILSSNLKEVRFPEYITYQSKDGNVTYTHKSTHAAVTIKKASGKETTYKFTHFGYQISSFSASLTTKIMASYYNCSPGIPISIDDGYFSHATYSVDKDTVNLEIEDLNMNKTLYRIPDKEVVFTETKAADLFNSSFGKMKRGETSLVISAKGFTKSKKSAMQRLTDLARENKIDITVCFVQTEVTGEQAKIYVNPSLIKEDLNLSTQIGSTTIENKIERQYSFKDNYGRRICFISNKTAFKNIPVRATLNLPDNYTLDENRARIVLPITIYQYTASTNALKKIANPNIKVDLEKDTVSFDIATGGDYIYCYGELVKKK